MKAMRHLRILGLFLRTAIPAGMVLTLIFYGLALATENFDITLNAGEAYVIDGASAAEVRYFGNPNSFSVQSPADNHLLVLGACRGSGTIKTTHNGSPAIYHVTVNAIADPNRPLKPGKSPLALTDEGGSGTGVKMAAVAAAKSETAAKRSQDKGAVIEDRGVHTETVASPATPAASSPVAVVPSQTEPPPCLWENHPGPLSRRRRNINTAPTRPLPDPTAIWT
jgi:hypothetical protein